MELLDTIAKCEISNRFRLILLSVVVVLLCFHFFVLTAPITCPTIERLEHYRQISNSLTSLSVSLILMFIVVQLHADIHTNYKFKRIKSYQKIEEQIINWFDTVKSALFEKTAVESSPSETKLAMQNFCVNGVAEKIMKVHNYQQHFKERIQIYCSKIHFELTNYPSEMIYGIHFELNNRELNENLCKHLSDKFGFSEQMQSFKVDVEIPKRPEWVFFTRTIQSIGDTEESFSINLTHARHFVELVGHTYEFLYSKEMIDLYLDWENSTPV